MIHVENLVKIFDADTRAVDGLNLNIETGEIFALLGPNGAGKTTTIRVLSTLAGFDEGKVEVAGFDMDHAPEEIRKSIGLVAQQTGIDYLLTGRENLVLQGQLYHLKKSEIKQRIDELADYFDLSDALDRQVMTYSGGMRRKLDIATALIHKPKLLFLDEPTLGLDIKSRKSLWHYIEKLNKELNLTILLTTHYLEEADKLSHRVAIINEGKICAMDTPEALKNDIGGDSLTLSFAEPGPNTQSFANQLQEQEYVSNIIWEGERCHIYVNHGAACVPKIAQLAGEQGIDIAELSLSRATLDDVFLRYTGNSLEEKEEEAEEWWHKWAGKGGGGKWAKKWQDGNADDEMQEPEGGWPTSEEEWDQRQVKSKSAEPELTKKDTQAWQQNQSSDQNDWQKWQGSTKDTPIDDADKSSNKDSNEDWKKWQNQSRDNSKPESDKTSD
ncbi:Efflux ABC transporter, ATP-binding protein [hydrothermal vent metagenome]|uniref:Efflux ABC transporter, ATP-binding protein n=1 Tax=hydrothermal vent metagenome TaxID=652676 RepID=A0A3B0ZDB9_9ZZZZ